MILRNHIKPDGYHASVLSASASLSALNILNDCCLCHVVDPDDLIFFLHVCVFLGIPVEANRYEQSRTLGNRANALQSTSLAKKLKSLLICNRLRLCFGNNHLCASPAETADGFGPRDGKLFLHYRPDRLIAIMPHCISAYSIKIKRLEDKFTLLNCANCFPMTNPMFGGTGNHLHSR